MNLLEKKQPLPQLTRRQFGKFLYDRKCKNCGNLFAVGTRYPKKITCSKNCWKKLLSKRKMGKPLPSRGGKINVVCAVCGKKFWKWRNDVRKTNCCSLFCKTPKFYQAVKKNGLGKQGKEEDTRIYRKVEKNFMSWFRALVVEGWNNIQTTKRQLFRSKIYSLPAEVFRYGSERRVCYGTSFIDGTGNWSFTSKGGDSSSYQSQSVGQSVDKLNAIQEQSRPQEARSRTQYKTTLAIPTLKQYKGRVWCVETSTGVFIARRNDKVFITGNSNFPKASDLSKMIDKNAGAEREVVGQKHKDRYPNGPGGVGFHGGIGEYTQTERPIPMETNPSTHLAKKYSGYKYSCAPLKQTNETIMVFQKPYKTGSALHDILALEKGDTTCAVGALNIDGTRVPIKKGDKKTGGFGKAPSGFQMGVVGESLEEYKTQWIDDGKDRYPSQTFIDSEAAKILDKQSGIKKSGTGSFKSDDYEHRQTSVTFKRGDFTGKGDIGGCSRILHTCDFEKDEHDLYLYCPKVSKIERSEGLNDMKNNHVTLKPISLNRRILKLFKTPNSQRICYPFAGAGSEIIGGILAGFTDWTACEISQDYINIAEARIIYWSARKQEKVKKQCTTKKL